MWGGVDLPPMVGGRGVRRPCSQNTVDVRIESRGHIGKTISKRECYVLVCFFDVLGGYGCGYDLVCIGGGRRVASLTAEA